MISSYQDNSFTIRESILPSIILTFSEKLNETPQLFGAEFKKDPNDDKRVLSVRNDIIDIFESFNLTNSITYKSNGNVDVVVKKPEIMKLLIKVELSNSVINIKERAFAHWENLAEIIIPNSVTSIGESAFAHSGLRSIIIPNSVMYLGNPKYLGLDRTDDPSFHLSKSPFLGKNIKFKDPIRNVARYGYVTRDGRFKQYGYNFISKRFFVEPMNLKEYPFILVLADMYNEQCLRIGEITRISNFSNNENYYTYLITSDIIDGNFIENLIIKRRYDEGGIFYNTPHLHTVIFETGSKIVNIPTGTFSNCISLTNLTLPDFLFSIDHRAFYNCNSLSFINLPNTLKILGTKAFYSSRLTTITIPKSVIFINNKVFMNSTMLSEVNFESESNLEIIGHEAFRGTAISSITIPNTVKILGEIYYLTEQNYDKHKNNGGVFSDCRFLENVTFEEGSEIKSINPFSFSNCFSLQTVKLPSNLASIEPFAFNNCKSLMSITIPKPVNYISGFNGCSKLKNVIFFKTGVAKGIDKNDTLTMIGWMAFANSGIESLDLRILHKLTIIDNDAFLECSELITIQFPFSVEIICNTALKRCKKLKNITMSVKAFKGIYKKGGPVKNIHREYLVMPNLIFNSSPLDGYFKIFETWEQFSPVTIALGVPPSVIYNEYFFGGINLFFTFTFNDPLAGYLAETIVRTALIVTDAQFLTGMLVDSAIQVIFHWKAIEKFFKSKRPQAGLDDIIFKDIRVQETINGPYHRVWYDLGDRGAGGVYLMPDGELIGAIPF